MKTKMGRPKVPKAKYRGIILQARLSPEENDVLQVAIAKSPHDKSEWIRNALLGTAKSDKPVSQSKSSWWIRRASNSQSGVVKATGLPVNLRTQCGITVILLGSFSIIKLTTDYMPNDDRNNGRDADPDGKPDEKELKKGRKFLPTRVVSIFILGLFATGFGVYGAGWLNGGFYYWGWGLIFVSASCGLWAARMWIINHRTKHQMPNWLVSCWIMPASIAVCAAACALAAILMSQEAKNATGARQDISEIKALLKSASAPANESETNTVPGIGFHAVLRLDGIIKNRPNYIFDWGESAESNRMSLYILPNTTLCLNVIDQDATPHIVKVKPGFNTFSLHSLLYLVADFGNAGDKSFLRIMANGNEVGFQIFSDLGSFRPNPENVRNATIGSDINRKNGSIMTIEFYAETDAAFNRKKRNDFMSALYELQTKTKPNEGGFVFNGNGGLNLKPGEPKVEPFGDRQWAPSLFNSTN